MSFLFEIIILLGLVFIFFGTFVTRVEEMVYGVSQLGETEVQNETLLSKTRITVVERGDEIVIDQKSYAYTGFIDGMKIMDGKIGGLIENLWEGMGLWSSLIGVLLTAPVIIGVILWVFSKLFIARGSFKTKFKIANITLLAMLFFFSFFEPATVALAKIYSAFSFDQEASNRTMKIIQLALEDGKTKSDKLTVAIQDGNDGSQIRVQKGDNLIQYDDLREQPQLAYIDDKSMKENAKVLRSLIMNIYLSEANVQVQEHDKYVNRLVNEYRQYRD